MFFLGQGVELIVFLLLTPQRLQDNSKMSPGSQMEPVALNFRVQVSEDICLPTSFIPPSLESSGLGLVLSQGLPLSGR